jgi:dTDP-4-amino-4,6-dideoxygalactose transaminase
MMFRHQLPAHSPLSSRALASGLIGALGSDARARLVGQIRAHWGARNVALTGSGTDALTLTLRAALLDRPRIVAVPAYGCYDLATAVVGAHARAVLYDIDPETLAPDLESLARALQHQPGALILVHHYGLPVDVPAIAALTARHETLLIEDAAQGIGSSVRNRPVGSFGSLAILSFGRGKGLTGGSGGAVLAHDDVGAEIVNQIRALLPGSSGGWSALARAGAQWVLSNPALYALPASLPFLRLGETVYHKPHEPDAISRSAVKMVDAVWDAAHAEAAIRRRSAGRLIAAAQATPSWHLVRPLAGAVPGYLRFPARSRTRPRKELLSDVARRLGINQGYPMPLQQLSGFRDRCINSGGPFPGAQLLADSLITLPTHSLLSAADLDALENWLIPEARPQHLQLRRALRASQLT